MTAYHENAFHRLSRSERERALDQELGEDAESGVRAAFLIIVFALVMLAVAVFFAARYVSSLSAAKMSWDGVSIEQVEGK